MPVVAPGGKTPDEDNQLVATSTELANRQAVGSAEKPQLIKN
jgi:hypothetical protein